MVRRPRKPRLRAHGITELTTWNSPGPKSSRHFVRRPANLLGPQSKSTGGMPTRGSTDTQKNLLERWAKRAGSASHGLPNTAAVVAQQSIVSSSAKNSSRREPLLLPCGSQTDRWVRHSLPSVEKISRQSFCRTCSLVKPLGASACLNQILAATWRHLSPPLGERAMSSSSTAKKSGRRLALSLTTAT